MMPLYMYLVYRWYLTSYVRIPETSVFSKTLLLVPTMVRLRQAIGSNTSALVAMMTPHPLHAVLVYYYY